MPARLRRLWAHLLLCTLLGPWLHFLAPTYPPPSFYALVLPGQDWACVSCLGMCLAQAEPSGVELARFYGRPRNSWGGALSKREKHSLSKCSEGCSTPEAISQEGTRISSESH